MNWSSENLQKQGVAKLFSFRFRQVARNGGLFLCLSVALWFQTGCQSTSSSSQTSIGSQYQTFAVSMLNPQGTPYERAAIGRLAPVAAETVTTTLTSKGYQEVPVENADLLVRLGGKFAPDFKAEVSQMTGSLTSNVTQESAQHRVLAIDVVDNHTKKKIWAKTRAGSGGGP